MDSRIRIAIGKTTRLALALCLLLAGCARAMHDDGRAKPLEPSVFFPDKQLARQTIPGTIARGELNTHSAFHTGLSNGNFVAEIPVQQNQSFLRRGQQRYDIFCAPCHDATGSGEGVIVQRGFKHPLPFTDELLRAAPAGYFFDAISRGAKTMFPMASQIPPEDRWAIVGYIRVLQRSQSASLADVPPEQRAKLEAQR